MSNGSYSWEQVMLGIDVQNESLEKARQQEDIETKRTKEANAASSWSLGLSILGAAIFGPIGYMAGKNIGKYGADWGWFDPGNEYSDWESMRIDEGKFNTEASKRYNKVLKQTAKDQTLGQAIGMVTDLATMYVQAGGLEGGDVDFTTFGTGGAEGGEWSFLGKGEETITKWVPGDQFTGTGAGTKSGYKDVTNPDYVPSLSKHGFTLEDATEWLKGIKP